jgi:serine/threonine protein phosphatase 1
MIFSKLRPANSRNSGLDKGPRVPDGTRVYAVGDVHGRLDLLRSMLNRILEDSAGRMIARTHIVMLGDLIDRGPDSNGVIELLRTFSEDGVNLVLLAGNHEEVILRILAGETTFLKSWISFGGTETLASYGLDADRLLSMTPREALALIENQIPTEHQRFLQSFSDSVKVGDYLFVHAGIRPTIPLAMQDQKDLRWIRQAFLNSEENHGFVVVHGHTISGEIVERANRIGIDTGAYTTGRLSAVGLEGAHRWFLEVTL